MHRMASYRIHQSLVEKPLRINEYWPMFSDGEKETIEPLTDEEVKALVEKHNKLFSSGRA